MRRPYLLLWVIACVDVLLLGIMIGLRIAIRDGMIQTAIEPAIAAERVTTALAGAAGIFTALGLFAFVLQRFNKD